MSSNKETFFLDIFTVPLIWLLILITYLYLARKWPQLMRKWLQLEIEMLRTYKYPSQLDVTFKKLIAVFVVAGTGIQKRFL